MSVAILTGDCRDVLRTLADESVHCVVTSPPYFGLRDYGVAGQIGLEPTPEAFVDELVSVFCELRRVLRKDGTAWLNLGDSYAGGGGFSGGAPSTSGSKSGKYGILGGLKAGGIKPSGTIKAKNLVGIPWRVAFALQADGWYLRQDIIWSKPNPMPESVTDRCTRAHEYIFLLSRRARYHYDAAAIAETAETDRAPSRKAKASGAGHIALRPNGTPYNGEGSERNRRSVWEVPTTPYAEAHFATFPPGLIAPCILAGCPAQVCAKCGAPWASLQRRTGPDGESVVVAASARFAARADGRPLMGDNAYTADERERGSFNAKSGVLAKETVGAAPSCRCGAADIPGTVLDPFAGAGTTGLVADRLGRNAILIELNPGYAAMAEDRLRYDAPLFVEIDRAAAPDPPRPLFSQIWDHPFEPPENET